MCQNLLAAPLGGQNYLAGASALNNDGVPLQLCLSSSRRGIALRVIGDPGTHYDNLEARYQCSRETLERCMELADSSSISPLVTNTLTHLIPSSEVQRAQYSNGFIWIAASPVLPGLAVYIDTAPLGKAGAWKKIEEWLSEVLPCTDEATRILATLRQCTVPASAGLEGHTKSNLRAKVYFRLTESLRLEQLNVDLFADRRIFEFLQIAMGRFGVDRDGLVLSVGFRVETGELADVKVDLCGHCLTYENNEWLEIINQLSSQFGLTSLPVDAALNEYGCRVAFIGFGLDRAQKCRLNLYLNAAESQDEPLQDELEAALTDGVRYLCALQDQDGHWADYQLPVGVSDQWITAYVGLALARVGNYWKNKTALLAAERAADWLCSERSYPAGWGYNATTGPDADSTAMAIGLLRELGRLIQPEDQSFLYDHWRVEGGLATYDGPQAWGVAHWDVTPFGYLGLNSEQQNELRDSFMTALKANLTENGMWRAYWWRNPYYSTFLTLEVLAELGIQEPEQEREDNRFEVTNPFDLACVIGIHHLRAIPSDWQRSPLRGLLNWQQNDGRWLGHPNLRVTDDSCFEPWDKPIGEYYTDHAATVTTATVIRVLTSILTK
ncbi:squalene-hopene cyclase [Leptolyngbya sp. Heron Island J]|nr:squalene-hopene cyclase [Leptolyngbya sp. Heron Island J]